MRTIKVAVCGLIDSPNLGEKFIADSLEYIIKKEYAAKFGHADTIDVEQVNILNAVYVKNNSKNTADRLYRVLRGIGRRTGVHSIKNMLFRACHLLWKEGNAHGKTCRSRFRHAFSNADVIVVDGAGLLEYSFNEYQEVLLLISELAEELNIPVIYNAVGTAGDFKPGDYRCKLLIRAMRSPQIKYVSARDNRDIVQQYVGDRIRVEQRADAAVLLNEAYSIEKKQQEAPYIGIGVIRGSALQSYHVDFNKDSFVRLFADIAEELARRGYRYVFFTNGLESDDTIGKEVLKTLNLPDEYLIERPTDARVLADTISGFSAMITCRMHSVIAGFSMGIPSVALSWNKKLDRLMALIGYPERVIDVSNFNAAYIVDMMEKALTEGYSEKCMRDMKKLAAESVREYLDIIHDCKKA